jgi:glycosyltransferase involved in cell wall biosynthesis
MVNSASTLLKTTTTYPKLTSLSVIIPAYNDETTVAQLISDVDSMLAEFCNDYEIIAINDGSKDNTLRVLRDTEQRIPALKVINHEVNQGFGATIRELYLAGTKEFVFSLPGDYQYAPKELLTMARALDRFDLVIGLRAKRNDPVRRRLQSDIYNFLLRVVYGINFTDVNSIKLFRKSILEHIPLKSLTPFVDAELVVRAHRAGYKVIEVPIEHLPRMSQGASGGKFSVIYETFSDMLKMRSQIP